MQYCCSCCCLGLWRSSLFKNGSDCAGQTPLYSIYICFQTWLIVILISLQGQGMENWHYISENSLKFSSKVSRSFSICRLSRHNNPSMSTMIFMEHTVHSCLTDFDNWMDHFGCDGSHDERMFRSCEEFRHFIENQLSWSVLIKKPCAFSYCANCTYSFAHVPKCTQFG